MNPGVSTRPSASNSVCAPSSTSPMAAITPSRIPTSATLAAEPDPSMTVAPLMTWSSMRKSPFDVLLVGRLLPCGLVVLVDHFRRTGPISPPGGGRSVRASLTDPLETIQYLERPYHRKMGLQPLLGRITPGQPP